MKSIELTEKHKYKLLEMCNTLFPELGSVQLGVREKHGWSNDFLVFGIEKSDIQTFVIHWFEFCINILCPQLTNRTAMFNDIEDDNIKLSIHPIDYLYKEFKKLNNENN